MALFLWVVVKLLRDCDAAAEHREERRERAHGQPFDPAGKQAARAVEQRHDHKQRPERDEHAAEVRSLRRTVRRHERESEALAEQLLELEEVLPTVGFGWGR